MSQESPEDTPFASPAGPSPAPPEQPTPPPPPPPYAQPYGAPPGPYGQPYGAPPPGPYGQPYPPPQGGWQGPNAYGPAPMDPGLAEAWQRLVARLVDGIVTAVILSPLWIWFFVWYLHKIRDIFPDNPDDPVAMHRFMDAELSLYGYSLLFGLVGAAFTFAYDGFQHAKWGQTIGKRVMKIKVVALPGRAPLSTGAAIKRAALYAVAPQVPGIGGIFALIDSLWLLWDKPHRQCLHDKVADTVVIKV